MLRTNKTTITILLVPLLFSIVISLPFPENDDFGNIEYENNVPESEYFDYARSNLGRRSLSVDPKYIVTRRIPPYKFGLGKRSNAPELPNQALKFNNEEQLLKKLYEDLNQGL